MLPSDPSEEQPSSARTCSFRSLFPFLSTSKSVSCEAEPWVKPYHIQGFYIPSFTPHSRACTASSMGAHHCDGLGSVCAHSSRANNAIIQCWGQRWGSGDAKVGGSESSFTSHLPNTCSFQHKQQQHCRPAPGMSSLTGPREEGCRKINGQHPFTVMGFCLGQWASSSY